MSFLKGLVRRKGDSTESETANQSSNRFAALEDSRQPAKPKRKARLTTWITQLSQDDSEKGNSQKDNTGEDDQEVSDEGLAFLKQHGVETIPKIPTTNRTTKELFDVQEYLDIWELSLVERTLLANFWSSDLINCRDSLDHEKFKNLRKKLEMSRTRYEALKDEVSAGIFSIDGRH